MPAGIRPLINVPGKSTTDVPREYKIFESPSGLISVAGGKLTTYRRMAKIVVDLSGVSDINLEGVATLLALWKESRERGKAFLVERPSERVREKLEITGVLKALAGG